MDTILTAVQTFMIFIIFATFHEYAHGWMANRRGDSTALLSGRLSLNPLVHIDPIWTILIPAMLLISTKGTFAFGAAKPVPVNPFRLRRPKKDMIWVGLAGPATNVIWALVLIFVMKAGKNNVFAPGSRLYLDGILYILLFKCVQINIVLLVFNLLPIPPLDGSRVVEGILPDKYSEEYAKLKPYGFMILILIMFMGRIDPRLNLLGQMFTYVILGVIKVFAL